MCSASVVTVPLLKTPLDNTFCVIGDSSCIAQFKCFLQAKLLHLVPPPPVFHSTWKVNSCLVTRLMHTHMHTHTLAHLASEDHSHTFATFCPKCHSTAKPNALAHKRSNCFFIFSVTDCDEWLTVTWYAYMYVCVCVCPSLYVYFHHNLVHRLLSTVFD